MDENLKKPSDETESDANDVIIPIIFDEFFKDKDLSYRYERHERIRAKCRKKYEKYGMENLFDNYEFSLISLKYPDNFRENRIEFLCDLATFINVFEDFINGTLNYKYNASNEEKKPKKTVMFRLLIIYVFKTLRLKFAIYQWYLFIKSFLKFMKVALFKRRPKVFNTYEEYAKQRRIDIGSEAIAIGEHKTFGYDLPRSILNHQLIKRFNFQFTDLIWQINDLYSFKKEFIRGEHDMNAVTALRNEHNTSWQSSVDMLANIVQTNLKELDETLKEIIESKLDVSHHCLQLLVYNLYVHCLVYTKSKRYNISKDINVKPAQ